jgi:hypothetical protein
MRSSQLLPRHSPSQRFWKCHTTRCGYRLRIILSWCGLEISVELQLLQSKMKPLRAPMRPTGACTLGRLTDAKQLTLTVLMSGLVPSANETVSV